MDENTMYQDKIRSSKRATHRRNQIVISILVAIIFTGVGLEEELFNIESTKQPALYSAIRWSSLIARTAVGALFGILCVRIYTYWQNTQDDMSEIRNRVYGFETKLIDKLNSSYDSLDKTNNKHYESMSAILELLMVEANVGSTTEAILRKKDNSIIKGAMNDIYSLNSAKIEVNRWGNFSIHGDDNAFNAYVLLWQRLVLIQKRRFEDPLVMCKDYLVARITHSTGADKWSVESENIQARRALSLQAEFLKYNGKIVRFFVCKEGIEPSNKLLIKKIIDEHRSQGIPTYYVETNGQYLSSDYLFFRTRGKVKDYTICKWHSGADGTRLVNMEIIDLPSIKDDTPTSWLHLWYRSLECFDENGFDSLEAMRIQLNRDIPPVYQYDFGRDEIESNPISNEDCTEKVN